MVRKMLLVVTLIVVVLSRIAGQTIKALGEDIKWTDEKDAAEVLEQ